MSSSIKVNVKDLNPAQVIAAVAELTPQIEFDPEWANGTGYYDGIVDVQFEDVGVRHFIDKSDRIGLVLPTRAGNLVMFQRYSAGGSGVVVSNYHQNLRGICTMLGFGSSVSRETICAVLSWLGGPNEDVWHIHENSSELAAAISTL